MSDDGALPALFQNDQTESRDLSAMEVQDIWGSLTELQQAWIEEYVTNGMNATQAAIDAGYDASSRRNYRVQGYNCRHNSKIKRLLEVLFAHHMPENEALERLTSIARADMSDFISLTDDGEPYVDLEKASDRGVMHLVKEVTVDAIYEEKDGERRKVGEKVKIKLHDQLKALDKILKVHGAYLEDDADAGVQTVNIFQNINGDLSQTIQGESE